MNEWLDRIRSVLGSLSAQERMLLGAVGVTLVIAILYFGALRPALGGLRDADAAPATPPPPGGRRP